jgi:hypothetical protein
MNLNSAQHFTKRPLQRGWRLCCALSAVLCIFLLTAVPALAEPVTINQVVQTLTSSRGTPDLRLNTLVAQDPGKGTQQGGPRGDTTPQAPAQGGGKNESLISTVTVTGEGQRLGVEVIEEGEVEGTICDCGQILVAGGSFPKWPFLFLAAVPIAFIHSNDCESCNDTPSSTPTPTPPSTPNPTPPPPGVPEPASILLFGTGVAAIGACLRRRYAKTKVSEQLERGEEE